MPALHLFNRRTLLAGDDLQLPSLGWGFLSAVQTFVFLPLLLYYDVKLQFLSRDEDTTRYLDDFVPSGAADRNLFDGDDFITSMEQTFPSMHSIACSEATSNYTNSTFPICLFVYLIGMSIFCAVSLWYEQRIFHLSSLGTPTLNIDLRSPLANLIQDKMTYLAGFNLLLLAYAAVITCIFIKGYWACFPVVWWIAYFILLASQTIQFLFVFTSLVSILRVKPVSTCTELARESSDLYQQQHDNTHHNNTEMAEELWRDRCEGCCRVLAVSTCFLFGGQSIVSASESKQFYGDISRALADYFAGFGDEYDSNEQGLDVVPSDVALGFVVLRHMQAQRKLVAKREALQQLGYGSRPGSSVDLNQVASAGQSTNANRRTLFFRWGNNSQSADVEAAISTPLSGELNDSRPNQPISPRTNEEYQSFSRIVLSPSNSEDVDAIIEGAHFARHQLAIYTWMLYYYMFPVTGTFRLIGRALRDKLKCSSNNTSGGYGLCPNDTAQQTIVGDNFLHIHEATMLAHAKLQKSDIAYASFTAGFYETPYCIVIDHKWKSIVLSIRGSLTLEDCVVDVLLDPIPLDGLGEQYGFEGSGQYCHGGVFECSRWLFADLERHKILDALMLGENAEYRDYTLRIVGHSLGAGIGVILSLMLRNTFPNLRCICYSPPGGLLTWDLATSCSDFVNSFVLDSDIVPRLSLNNMESLRDEVLNLIARVKLSKYDIAKRIFWHSLCGEEVELGDLDFLIQQNDDILYPADSIPDSEFLQQLRWFESMQRNRRANRGMSREVSLYPPGNIIHLVKTGQSNKCSHNLTTCLTCGASNAGSEYTPIMKENDDFNEIEISPTLWTDHFPNRVCIELERVAERFESHKPSLSIIT